MSEREERKAAYRERIDGIRQRWFSPPAVGDPWGDVAWLLDELEARERQVGLVARLFLLSGEEAGRLMWEATPGGGPGGSGGQTWEEIEEDQRMFVCVMARCLLEALSERIRTECTMDRARALTLAAKTAAHPTTQGGES